MSTGVKPDWLYMAEVQLLALGRPYVLVVADVPVDQVVALKQGQSLRLLNLGNMSGESTIGMLQATIRNIQQRRGAG